MAVFKMLQNIVVAVKDLQAATADWERCFSTKAVKTSEEAGSRQAQFNVGEAWIALAQPLKQRGALWEHLQTRGEGFYSVAVQVEDVKAAAKRAREHGGILEGEGGPVSIDPRSTNGVRIELWPQGPKAAGPRLFRRFHHLVVASNGTQAAAAKWQSLFGDPGSESSHLPAGQAYFGLVDGVDHPPPVAKFLKERGEGVFIVSVVDDTVTATVRAIREHGGRIIGNEEGGGQLFVHPATTHGILLEINDEGYTRSWVADYGKPPFGRAS